MLLIPSLSLLCVDDFASSLSVNPAKYLPQIMVAHYDCDNDAGVICRRNEALTLAMVPWHTSLSIAGSRRFIAVEPTCSAAILKGNGGPMHMDALSMITLSPPHGNISSCASYELLSEEKIS